MNNPYTTKAGDVLDKLCWAQYPEELATLDPVAALQFEKRKSTITDLVMRANPHVADFGPILPAGVVITFPILPRVTTVDDTVRFYQ